MFEFDFIPAADLTPTDDFFAANGDEADELPIGGCSHCGDVYYTPGERRLHDDAECIGGYERFDGRL